LNLNEANANEAIIQAKELRSTLVIKIKRQIKQEREGGAVEEAKFLSLDRIGG